MDESNDDDARQSSTRAQRERDDEGERVDEASVRRRLSVPSRSVPFRVVFDRSIDRTRIEFEFLSCRRDDDANVIHARDVVG
jgi:hypothetical protein